jgi:hypothetical protein
MKGLSFILVVAFAFTTLPLIAQTEDDPTKPFNWPVVGSQAAGVQLSLRTRWSEGVLQYVATLTDSKGRAERYFSRHPDTGAIPLTSFHITLFDEADFRLYVLYISDRTFSKTEGTVDFKSDGESGCTEKIYRAALKAAQAAASGTVTIELAYPSELTEAALPPAKKK